VTLRWRRAYRVRDGGKVFSPYRFGVVDTGLTATVSVALLEQPRQGAAAPRTRLNSGF
jgi:hypothetical protein